MPTPDGLNEAVEQRHAEELRMHDRMAVLGGLLTAREIFLNASSLTEALANINTVIAEVVTGTCQITVMEMDEEEFQLLAKDNPTT